VTLIGASLYFSTDGLPSLTTVLLRDNLAHHHHHQHQQHVATGDEDAWVSPPVSSPVLISDLPVIFVSVGLCLSLVSFLGCCGACSDSVCFMAFVSRSHTHTHAHTHTHSLPNPPPYTVAVRASSKAAMMRSVASRSHRVSLIVIPFCLSVCQSFRDLQPTTID